MCGICGIIDYTNKDNLDESTIRKMCNEMKHRGPDDEGIYIQRGQFSAGLGHRRLSIIDLSAAGHQPMANEDKSIWLVFNGEVYNYKELKVLLENKRHKFQSNTDAETIIHLYEEYGEDCVNQIRGMFAFAIWDQKKQILFAARDRLGKKPFIYCNHNGKLCFASEFNAFLASNIITKEINLESVDYYLTFGYIPAPLTIYKKVLKLPAAHILLLKEGKVTVKQYWDLDYRKKINISEQDASDEIIRLLKEAIKIRLSSDVPLGAFLSGGIDSSTIVGLMSQVSHQRIKTFSIGFEEKDYSELKYARGIAKRFNTEHNEFIVRPQALEILPLLVERYGEPYADSSCIPTYYVARETKKYVTVALNGDGGDENFAGYERYQAMIIAEVFQRIPQALRSPVQKLSKLLPDSADPRNNLRRARRFFDVASLPFNQRYIRWIGIFNDDLKKRLYAKEFSQHISGVNSNFFIEKYLNGHKDLSILERLINTDVHTYLPDDLLVKVDITGMTNSLEGRSPFLDHVFMEFVAKLPAEYKLKSSVKKYILKKAINGLVPKENIYRRKMGFGVPIGKWFRGELKGFLEENLLSEAYLKRGYFQPDILKVMIRDHAEGRKDYTFQLWSLLMLELWHKRFMD